MASNAENVSIWWRHHERYVSGQPLVQAMASWKFGANPLPEPNADRMAIGALGTNFSEILLNFSYKKMYFGVNMSAKLRLLCGQIRTPSCRHSSHSPYHSVKMTSMWRNFRHGLTFTFQLTETEWRMYAPVIQAIIGSDNGFSPVRRLAIIRTNAGVLLIEPMVTKFSEILIRFITIFIHENAFENVVCKIDAFCRGLKVLISVHRAHHHSKAYTYSGYILCIECHAWYHSHFIVVTLHLTGGCLHFDLKNCRSCIPDLNEVIIVPADELAYIYTRTPTATTLITKLYFFVFKSFFGYRLL